MQKQFEHSPSSLSHLCFLAMPHECQVSSRDELPNISELTLTKICFDLEETSAKNLADCPTQLICNSDIYLSIDRYKRHSRVTQNPTSFPDDLAPWAGSLRGLLRTFGASWQSAPAVLAQTFTLFNIRIFIVFSIVNLANTPNNICTNIQPV